MPFINIRSIFSIICSCIIVSVFYSTHKVPKTKEFIYNLFLLNKFPPNSLKYVISKVLMILYVFLICNYIIGFIVSINLNAKSILIIGVLYPLAFRAFFNGSYNK